MFREAIPPSAGDEIQRLVTMMKKDERSFNELISYIRYASNNPPMYGEPIGLQSARNLLVHLNIHGLRLINMAFDKGDVDSLQMWCHLGFNINIDAYGNYYNRLKDALVVAAVSRDYIAHKLYVLLLHFASPREMYIDASPRFHAQHSIIEFLFINIAERSISRLIENFGDINLLLEFITNILDKVHNLIGLHSLAFTQEVLHEEVDSSGVVNKIYQATILDRAVCLVNLEHAEDN